ncbi:MAG: D-alanine--D-alanine ligase [Endomicrobium sp.]|jgi:D-alanine-D-alanine ligase|nr:D-alanine--D-alanine ligase [Endomicrobium sp.]
MIINSDILAKIKNKKIGVLYGGESYEKEVSIKSGKAVLNALKNLHLNVCGIYVDRNIICTIKKSKIDIACIMLHGLMGEDGTIQGMLELLNIPYTGCGVFANAASIDKDISKKLFKCAGILTPKWKTFKKFELVPSVKKYPVVVKPSTQGSTIGLTVVKKTSQFSNAVKNAFKYGPEIVVERFIKGKEITVGVMDGKALPIIEIVLDGDLYDFKSKYENGGSKHIIPARISKKVYKTAQRYAEKIYKLFKCKAICRVDMIVDKNDKVWVLENNTIPGMTETSLIPDACKCIGYNFENLVLKILESAL